MNYKVETEGTRIIIIKALTIMDSNNITIRKTIHQEEDTLLLA